ncbi:hypothetical protein L249_4737 [Ophiocordyceps polyrhachis-furcata BCC 54312]|uniref:Uncharacterized protein n=1 Tax=Ophiocordyceps polyrhachis-furcata BCC 54312 TaxID=1330021 RepID=A0A367L2F0_9HYPO|nr:hypothetical protein L249_4737 [Ophiocordyceps polyrhachis-furcata BCC 54312]
MIVRFACASSSRGTNGIQDRHVLPTQLAKTDPLPTSPFTLDDAVRLGAVALSDEKVVVQEGYPRGSLHPPANLQKQLLLQQQQQLLPNNSFCKMN